MEPISWRDLCVTDADGFACERLGVLVDRTPDYLEGAVIREGRIAEWSGFLVYTEGEKPDWDTPRAPVNWTGFEACLTAARAAQGEEGR